MRQNLVAAVLLVGCSWGCAHPQARADKDAVRVGTRATRASISPPEAPPSVVEPPPFAGAVLHFDFDVAVLTPGSARRLQQVADLLRENRRVTITIAGNCDERGTEEYNLALGNRRAEVAKTYLVDLGVSPSRILTISFGHERPIASGHDEAAWAENRRDEVHAN